MFKIRTGKIADFKQLETDWAWKQNGKLGPIQDYINGIKKKNQEFLVITDGPAVIGEIHIYWKNKDPDEADGKKRAYLSTFRIHPKYRGQGLGTKLMHRALEGIKEKNFTEATIAAYEHEPQIQTLYKKWGFTELIKKGTEGKTPYILLLQKLIKEIYVDPRHIEHAFDLAFWRDNKKLWALKVPVEEMHIDELVWIFDVPFWEDENGNIVITPNEVIQKPDQYPYHTAKIKNCDTSYPLDIMKNKKGKWLTLDGLHRLVKLAMAGKKIVRVRKIPPELVHLTARDE